MGDLADRLDRLVVTADSPDRQIRATIRDRGTTIKVQFARGAYPRYRSEDELARQLARLATHAWTRFRRDTDELIDYVAPGATRRGADEYAQERRHYEQRLSQLEANGSSPDSAVSITTHALSRWQITIAPGVLGALSERDFVSALRHALTEVLASYRTQLTLIKDETFGLAIPLDERPRGSGPARQR